MTILNYNPTGRGIILSGSRQIAGQYVQIAKRRATEFKFLLDSGNLKFGQKKYMLQTDCVWCLINIIDGATFIRIHACTSGGDPWACDFNAGTFCDYACSDFEMECYNGQQDPDPKPTRPKWFKDGNYGTRVRALSLTPGGYSDWDTWTYDWGDGNIDPDGYWWEWHTYDKPGRYEISIEVTSEAYEYGPGGDSGHTLEKTYESDISEADAYANFTAMGFTDDFSGGSVTYHSGIYGWNNNWYYMARRPNYTYDFSQVPPDARIEFRSVITQLAPPITGLTTTEGGEMVGEGLHAIDLTHLIGNPSVNVQVFPIEGYPSLAGGGFIHADADRTKIMIPARHKKTTRFVQVDVGGKTREYAEPIHEDLI
jgi:hypothetical protein